MRIKYSAIATACVLALAALAPNAQAASLYFDAAGGTKTWDEGSTADWANMSGGNPAGTYDQLWSNSSDAVFEGTGGTVDVSAISSVKSIAFNVGGYTLSGGSISITGAGGNVSVASGMATIGSNITYNFGEVGMTKTGAGTLYLTGNNDFVGTININEGTLRLSGANPAPSYAAFSVNNGGTISLDTWNANPNPDAWYNARIGNLITQGSIYAGGTVAFDTTNGNFNYNSGGVGQNVLRGGMAFAKNGPNMVVFESANSYEGGTKVNQGILLATTKASLPRFDQVPSSGGVSIYDGGTLALRLGGADGFSLTDVGNCITAADVFAGGAVGLDTTNGDFVYDGTGTNQLRGPMGLTKLGPNSLKLVGQAYGGATRIYGGSLIATTPSELPRYGNTVAAGGVALYSGGTLQINAGGTGEWTEADIGAFINNGDQYAGGQLAIDTTNGDFSLGDTANVRGQVGITKVGANKLTMNKVHTYEGSTIIDGGSMVQGVANSLPAGGVTVNTGGKLDLGGFDATFNSLSGLGTVANDSTASSVILTIGSSSADTTFGGVIQDGAGAGAGKTVSLVKTGSNTLRLSGVNTYGGTTAVNVGTLVAVKPTSVPNWTTKLTVASGATFGVGVGPGEWTSANIDTLAASFPSGATLGIDTTDGDFSYVGTPGVGIAGPIVLNKIGTGKLTVTGANTYTGKTTISAGTLQAATPAALPRYDQYVSAGGVEILANGTLGVSVGGVGGWSVSQIGAFISAGDQYAGSQLAIDTTDGDFTYDGTGSNQIRGQVGLTKNGPNTLTVSTAQNYHGRTYINAGALRAPTTASLPGYDQPQVNPPTPENPDPYRGFDVGVPDPAVNAVNQPTLILNVGGTGEWTVNQLGDAISAGNLWYGSTLALDTTGGDFTADGTGHYQIRGLANLDKLGSNSLILAVPTFHDVRTTTKIRGGSIVLADSNGLQHSVLDYNTYGGVLSFGHLGSATLGGLMGSQNLALTNADGGPVALQLGDDNKYSVYGTAAEVMDTTYNGWLSGDGSLEKIGNCTVTLTGVNSYTGGTTITAGTLIVPTTASLPGFNQSPLFGGVYLGGSGRLQVQVGGSGWTVANIGGFISNGAQDPGSQLAIDTTNGDFVYDGTGSNQIRGSVGLTKVGPNKLTLTQPQAYEGGTRIYGGTLVAATPGLVPSYDKALANGGIAVYAGGTLQINAGGTGEWTTADIGAFINNGDQYLGCQLAIDTSNGDFTLDGTSNVRGQVGITKLGANKLIYAMDHNYDGLTIVKAGTLQVGEGSYTNLAAKAGVDIQGGKTVLDYSASGTSPATDVQTMLAAGYLAGWDVGPIRNTTADTTGLSLGWADDTTLQQVTIMATYAGDANLNGTVNVADLTLLLNNYNKTSMVWKDGDFNYDGVVNVADLTALLNKYNKSVGGSVATMAGLSTGGSAVPEPSTLALLATGLLGLLAYAWRKRK